MSGHGRQNERDKGLLSNIAGYAAGAGHYPPQHGGSYPPSAGSYLGPAYPPAASYTEPTYPEPSYPEPSYPEPTYPEPSYPEPSYPEPTYPEPSYPEPGYPRAGSYPSVKDAPAGHFTSGGGYPPQGLPPAGYPDQSPSHTSGGHKPGVGTVLAGGTAAAATSYGVHQLTSQCHDSSHGVSQGAHNMMGYVGHYDDGQYKQGGKHGGDKLKQGKHGKGGKHGKFDKHGKHGKK